MSFGWSGSDVFLLAQLAWNTVQNSRKACGEYDELTREALRLHAVLQRLEQEVAKSESPLNRPGETSKEQLQRIATDCEVVLRQLDKIVAAYASLSEEKRSARKIWQRVRFGNGQMADLGDLRSKMTLYTSEMLLYLNLVSMSTVGRIEQRMDRDGGVLREIKIAVEKKTAHTVLCGGSREGSVLTTYADDDAKFWRGYAAISSKTGYQVPPYTSTSILSRNTSKSLRLEVYSTMNRQKKMTNSMMLFMKNLKSRRRTKS